MSFSEFIKDDACRTVDDMIDFAAVRMPNLTERVLRGPLGRTLESDDIVRKKNMKDMGFSTVKFKSAKCFSPLILMAI